MERSERPAEPESEAMLRVAAELIKTGKASAARAPLLEFLDRSPGDCRARYALGVAQLKSGNSDAALSEFETLLDQLPQHNGAAFGRGLALFALGERGPALGIFRSLTDAGPFAWKAWASIADITPHEIERIHALGAAADALVGISARSGEVSDRRTAAAALMAARRPAEAEALLARFLGPVSGAPMPDRLFARALYHQGRFEDAFSEACSLLVHTPEPHTRTSSPPGFRPDSAGEVLSEILEMLSASRVTAFLAAGTLLGFHRQGAPLAHDRDIDIGVIRKTSDEPDIAGILRVHDRILLPRIARPGDRYFGVTHKGVAVDIFLHDETGDHLTCGFSRLDGDIQWRFRKFDIASADYGGRHWPVPALPGRYLAETYGPGWSVQDKGFASVVSSPALYRTDAHVRAYYAALRARAAFIAGDIDKACALIRQSPIPLPQPAVRQSGHPKRSSG